MTTRIAIAICTFRRTHLVQTIASIAALELPFNSSIHLIVVGNDETPSAQIMVAQTAETYKLENTYLHAPMRNIAIARNACLAATTADFIAFIDDDELASPTWLVALMEQQRESQADIILGPVHAVYETTMPRWLIAEDFHSTRPVWVRNRIITGYTGNVLMRRDAPALAGLTFDVRYGSAGGEDTDFFTRAHQAGARFDYAPAAAVYEHVAPERANFRWLRHRHFRYGQIHGLQLLAKGHARGYGVVVAALKASLYLLMMLWSPHQFRRFILRSTLHAGVVSTLLRRTH